MNVYQFWLGFVSLLMSVTASASVDLSDVQTGEQQAIFDDNPVSHAKQNPATLVEQTDSGQTEQAKAPLRVITHRSVLFQSEPQSDPNYTLLVDFAPPTLAGPQKYTISVTPIPWYFKHQSNSARLAGWKDGNSLYAARITYNA